MGISTLTSKDRASAGRRWVWTRFTRQSYEHWRDAWPHDRRSENIKGRRVCFWTGGPAVWIPAAERSTTSERDPIAGRLYDATRRACLPHHRIRRIRLFTVSIHPDMFDDCLLMLCVALRFLRASALIDKSPTIID